MMPDLSGHDHLGNPFLSEPANEPAKLADAHPLDSVGALLDLRRRLLFDRGNHHLDAAFSRAVEHEKWKSPVAGYQSVLHNPRLNPTTQRQNTITGTSFVLRWFDCV
jgi:hypothetical protein